MEKNTLPFPPAHPYWCTFRIRMIVAIHQSLTSLLSLFLSLSPPGYSSWLAYSHHEMLSPTLLYFYCWRANYYFRRCFWPLSRIFFQSQDDNTEILLFLAPQLAKVREIGYCPPRRINLLTAGSFRSISWLRSRSLRKMVNSWLFVCSCRLFLQQKDGRTYQ